MHWPLQRPQQAHKLNTMKLDTRQFISHAESEKKNHQLTVRFSSSQINEIERLSEQSGVSLAEAARRLVERGSQEVRH